MRLKGGKYGSLGIAGGGAPLGPTHPTWLDQPQDREGARPRRAAKLLALANEVIE
jgi:hypothetical protein